MKVITQFLSIVAACLTLVAGQAVRAESRTVISDIELAHGGTLSGLVVDQQGQALGNKEVALQQGNTVVARTVTDARGNFKISGLNSGVYELQTAGKTSAHRLWAADVAPPSAHRGIMVVSQSGAVRGQVAGLGGLGGAGAAAAAATAGYFIYDEVINDRDPAS